MAPLVQFLLIISYALVGLAVAVLTPRLGGADPYFAALGGAVIFLATWLAQVWLTLMVAERQRGHDQESRLDRLEERVRALRGELERTRRHTARMEEQGLAHSDHVKAELKMLETLLDQVSRKEAELAEREAAAPAAPPAMGAGGAPAAQEPSAEDAGDEPLSLTPEEAAMVQDDEAESTGPVRDREDEYLDSEIEHGDSQATPPLVRPEGMPPIRLIRDPEKLLSVIKSSLSENRIDLYLQPIVELPGRRDKHYECFSRIRDADGFITLPRQYMAVAEESGLVGTLDNLLLFRIIQLVRKLGKRQVKARFFCNLSRYSLTDKEFFPQFVDFMIANDEFVGRLAFEISQADYAALGDDIREQIRRMSRKGFDFSMDGVRDMDLDAAALGRQGFRFIKPDVDALLSAYNPGEIPMLKGHLRGHGMELIAARLETDAHLKQVLDGEVELAQGYFFSEPRAVNKVLGRGL
ncbi:EAL domain-containing protein [Yunchengibacter salinarum]|uniref:EAL domain-containing protein n=1 Tax=Yunchengibacter salinarum TaxID=3133399 RepID=UPI0035B6544D